MEPKKISELPTVTTLAPSDVFPVVAGMAGASIGFDPEITGCFQNTFDPQKHGFFINFPWIAVFLGSFLWVVCESGSTSCPSGNSS